MLHSDLNKAKKLKELEDKILALSPDFGVNVFIQLYQDFYEGVKELKNKKLGISTISISAKTSEENDLVEYLQYLLVEERFSELYSKKLSLVSHSVVKNTPDFSFEKARADFEHYFFEAYNNLDQDVRDELDSLLSLSSEYHDDHELDKLADYEFYSWFSPDAYIESLRSVGALVIKTDSLPEHFDRITATIKESFAFQQYLAVAVLCRTALEVALRDLYKKLGFTSKRTPENIIAKEHFSKIRKATGKTYPNQFNPEPRDLRQLICKLEEYQEYEEELDKLYGELSRVVHGNKIVKRKEAEKFIQEVYWLIHDLYMELKTHNN